MKLIIDGKEEELKFKLVGVNEEIHVEVNGKVLAIFSEEKGGIVYSMKDWGKGQMAEVFWEEFV